MKVVFHEDFYQVYTMDPAASEGRLEAVMKVIASEAEIIVPNPATMEQIASIHSQRHIQYVERAGLLSIASLAAGAAIKTAEISLTEPCFGLLRPPGHHASADSAWGFCYFNNMAVAIDSLYRRKKIKSAYVIDVDLHYGDGTANILSGKSYASVYNVEASGRDAYMADVKRRLQACRADVIGISAGFDNHEKDWGGLLKTEDYEDIGYMAAQAAHRCGGGCFAILEGGYNHSVLGYNVKAMIDGLKSWNPPRAGQYHEPHPL